MDTFETYEYTQPDPQPPKKRKLGQILLAVTLAAAVLVVSCGATALIVSASWQSRMEERNEKTNLALNALEDQLLELQTQIKNNGGNSVSGTPNTPTVPENGLTPSQVYAQNVHAVVAISNQATTNVYGQITETASSGSGFIISPDGYVVTNYHVAEGASRLTVMLQSGKEYEATLVGYDAANDMAVLKIDAKHLPHVTLGKSSDLIVGDQVVAIGNPLGELTNTLTVGYVSAIDRDISTGGALINMLQTDAAINSGNSGGPLFNMKGEVVGITTAKYSGTSGSGATIEGISFAIPIDDVSRKINDLKTYGYLTGAYLGITVSDTDQSSADYFGIPSGAYVRSVEPGTCAAKAGLQPKDVIIQLAGHRVSSMNDLSRALEKCQPGETVELVIYRSGRQLTLSVTLDSRPQTNNSDAPAETEPEATLPNSGAFEDWWDFIFGNGNN